MRPLHAAAFPAASRSAVPVAATALLVVLAVLTGCETTADRSHVTVRDSLGVRIVESRQAEWNASDVPRLDSAGRIRVGSVDGDPTRQLFRVTGAARLSSGRIVITNAGTNEVRWHDAAGNWERSTGGAGDGPGEYRGMRTLLAVSGDSVLVEDGLRARMTLYDGTGELRREWAITPLGPFVTPPPIGRLADGRFAAMTERSSSTGPGHSDLEAVVVRYDSGDLLDTVVRFRGSESYVVPCGGPPNPAVCNVGVPYGRKALAATLGEHVVTGTGERYELHVYTLTGALTAIYRRDTADIALDAARLTHYVDSLAGLQRTDDRRAQIREWLAGAPVPRAMPAFTQMVVEDGERLWLARPTTIGSATRPWDVLAADGTFLGTVRLPAGLRVMSIAHGHLVGVSRDEDDVEYVDVFRLVR